MSMGLPKAEAGLLSVIDTDATGGPSSLEPQPAKITATLRPAESTALCRVSV